MKKILLLLLCILSLVCHSQNRDYLATLKSLPSEAAALEIANEVALLSGAKLRLYKAKETPQRNYFVVKYVPAALTDDEAENDEDKSGFLTIRFTFSGKENKTYRLSELYGSFDKVFPYWKKYFRSDAEPEATQTSYELQRIKEIDNGLNFYIKKSDATWTLYNQS